ncbi:sorting nexin-like protein [Amylocarpus encephaloides]|uniref:Endosomal/vacuolar adapter protein YPT35 n=1 Tax=Amylocarpus encephaloides TaxID=45428 RepID=A0A9P8C2W2_9HELO|nr:sorting nexin-like protein [Amylocarpus encephaloides]
MEAAIQDTSAAATNSNRPGAWGNDGVDSNVNDDAVTSPPYWVRSHQRSFSNISVDSIPDGGITLQDNTDGTDSKNEACWAKSVDIEGYVIVNGNRTGIGAFVVWNIKVDTLRGGTMRIRKRYSEFDDLREKLMQTFPNSEGALPPMPPKSVISKFRPKFLEKRRAGLQYFLNCILLNPQFSGSPVLKEFLFSLIH